MRGYTRSSLDIVTFDQDKGNLDFQDGKCDRQFVRHFSLGRQQLESQPIG
jgi:hypothetical protein